MRKATIWTLVVAVALLALLLVPLSTAQATIPQPLAIPTPVTAPAHSTAPNAPEFPLFFNAKPLTDDARSSCFEVPEYSIVDLQWLIDQTIVNSTANTITLKLQYSNDDANYVDGASFVSSNAADAGDMQQYNLFGRYTCIYADVSNTQTVTVTVIGAVK